MSQPKWMKERIRQVEFLRGRGYDSCLLSHSTESVVKQMYEKEVEEGQGEGLSRLSE